MCSAFGKGFTRDRYTSRDTKFRKDALSHRILCNTESRVARQDCVIPAKSVGHGITCVADLTSPEEAKKVVVALSQDIGYKLRLMHLRARSVHLSVRDSNLNCYGWQTQVEFPIQDENAIARESFKLLESKYIWQNPIRSITVSAIQLERVDIPIQLSIFYDSITYERREKLNRIVDDIRDTYGKQAIFPAIILDEKKMPRGKRQDIIMPGYMYQ